MGIARRAERRARCPLCDVGIDARHVGMSRCRGYTLGVMLGWGVVGVWLGMFLDWAVRGALFYWRMVSGRWLWKYPRKNA
ncbi:MATE efflux family protein [Enterobacter asburiae]|uniref:MATE efflux family protein n=1 Tax=Enterobacter asburiae TaxID=61645 RepID=A0A376FN20_ENTAS|nr:MATE efflux family protein [Enterobacter asburiae]